MEKLDNQQKIIEKIEKIVTPVVNEMGLSLVDIEYMQDGGYWYVRIYVENLNGEITLEECAAISGKIDEDVDKLIEQRFFLEVSSPGIERPLKKIEDFIRFKGEKIKVSLKHKINDKKSFEGIITECKDNIIFLEIEEENIVEIPFSEVKKANIIHGIVRELRNENIDVINYTSNISLFIQRALSPAKISSIRLNEEEKKAEVFLKPEEVSLAIGKGGLNIKLASMLTEYTIDVFRELDENVADEDIYLDEFRDEIDGWVIDAIKAIGIDTAKAVLNAPREMLIEKTDLEEETVDEVIRILKSEFEEEEPEEEPEQGQE